jgi:hypothetical protein
MQARGARRIWGQTTWPAALLLAACSPQPAADTSEPQPAAETVGVTPWPADYAAMRAGAAGWAADEVSAEQKAAAQSTANGFDQPGQFDIYSCAEPDFEPGEIDARTSRLAALAHEAVLLEARLKAAGYDPAIWGAALATLQTESLKLFDGQVPEWGTPEGDALDARLAALREQAVATMELQRQTVQPSAPTIISEGGCGAAETPFLVKADPPGGRVWLTTRFTFQTCQAMGKPAWDTAQCRWTELAPDREEYLSGNYMVQARWPDGRSLRSSQRFQGDMADLESSDPVTVTIRPG